MSLEQLHSAIGASPPADASKFGAWRIVRPLGRGGMSEVFFAVRDDEQYQQKAAIKVLSVRATTPALEYRFRAERQILASLNHPYIARLLDGGATPSGTPYLVMEYIDGLTLNNYCSRRGLSLTEKLNIFLQVCAAVHYAHQHMVIHRDLKPANIMVTSEGIPKLLDFGIAKLLGTHEAGSHVTQPAERMLTPTHASPEQILGKPVSAASDIYSLGVVLYELLTSRLPHTVETGSIAELYRIATLADPAPPALNAELDAIILKALRREPEQRYASVEQLSEDVQCYLAGMPVRAREGTWRYRAAKFVGRHKLAVSAGGLALVTLVGFAGSMAVLSSRLATERDAALKERHKAEQVVNFLEDVFHLADPNQSKGHSVTAKELLDRGATRIREELKNQPETLATLLHTIASVYNHLGQTAESEGAEREALQIRRRELGDSHPDVAEALYSLAAILNDNGDAAKAEPLARQALEIRRRVLGPEDPATADTMSMVAHIALETSKLDEAEQLLRQGLAIRRKALGEEHPSTGLNFEMLGMVLLRQGKTGEAEELLQRALAINNKVHTTESVQTAGTMNNLAIVRQRRGDLEGALDLHRRVLAIRRKMFEPAHPEIITSLRNLTRVLREYGDLDEAARVSAEALPLARKTAGGRPNFELSAVLLNAGMIASDQGDTKAAISYLQESLEMTYKMVGTEHPWVARGLRALAIARTGSGELDEAVRLSGQALATQSKLSGRDNLDVAPYLDAHAIALSAKGDLPKSEETWRRSVAVRRAEDKSGNELPEALVGLAAVLVREKRPAEAEPLLREAVGILKGRSGSAPLRLALAENALGECLMAQGQIGEAEKLLRKSYAAISKSGRPLDRKNARARMAALSSAAR